MCSVEQGVRACVGGGYALLSVIPLVNMYSVSVSVAPVGRCVRSVSTVVSGRFFLLTSSSCVICPLFVQGLNSLSLETPAAALQR